MVTALIVIAALIVGCRGLGRAVLGTRRAPNRADPYTPAVTGLTGLALLTWVSGWLVVAGVYSETAASLLLTAGIAAWFLRGPRPDAPRIPVRPEPRWNPAAVLLGLLALALGLMRVAGDLALNSLSACADLAASLHFPRLMLESGGFIEPFSFRRLGTLGAAPMLQGYLWPYFYTAAPLVTDALVGQMLLWAAARELPGILSGAPVGPVRREAFGLGGLLVAWTAPVSNSLPVFMVMGGALVLLLLTRHLCLAPAEGRGGLRSAVAWGLVAAWLLGLRTSVAPFPALLWAGCLLWAAWQRNPRLARQLAVAAAALVVGLLPWSISLWESSGTPLFPLWSGNYRPGGVLGESPEAAALLAYIGECLWQSRVWVVVLMAIVVALRPAGRTAAVGLALVMVGLVVVTAGAMAGFGAATVHRYTAPFLGAGVVFLAALVLPSGTASLPRARWQPLAMAVALVLWLLMPVAWREGGGSVAMSNLFRLQVNLRSYAGDALAMARSGLAIPVARGAAEYGEAQALLPPDARVLVAADMPFYFRFDGQTVHTVDLPGEVSPDPGMPFFAGREPLAIYLRGLGYTHLAFTPAAASACMYSPELWSGSDDPTRPAGARRAPYTQDFIGNAELLTRTYPVTYAGRGLVVVDLRQPAANPGATN